MKSSFGPKLFALIAAPLQVLTTAVVGASRELSSERNTPNATSYDPDGKGSEIWLKPSPTVAKVQSDVAHVLTIQPHLETVASSGDYVQYAPAVSHSFPFGFSRRKKFKRSGIAGCAKKRLRYVHKKHCPSCRRLLCRGHSIWRRVKAQYTLFKGMGGQKARRFISKLCSSPSFRKGFAH